MKSTALITMISLVGFLMFTSCGKQRHNTQQDTNDDYDDNRDTTSRDSRNGPSGELVPIEKDLNSDDFKSLEALNSSQFKEILEK